MKQLSDAEARTVRDAFESAVGALPPAPQWEDFETSRGLAAAPRRDTKFRPILAVGIAASLVLIAIGGLSWWLRGEGSGTAPAVTSPPAVTELPIPKLTESQTWVNPMGGISLTLDRYEIPARPGLHEIEVAGAFEPYSRIWECRGLHGVLEPAADVDINEACTELEAMQTIGTRRAVFVTVDETVIDEGSLVIAVNGALGSWAGTARVVVVPRAPETVSTGLGQISWESAAVDGEFVDLHVFDGAFVAREYASNGSETRLVTSSDGLRWSPLAYQPPGHGDLYEYDGALWTMGPQLTSGPFGDVPSVFRLDALEEDWAQVPALPGGPIDPDELTFVAGPAGAIVLGARNDGAAVLWRYGPSEDGIDRFNVVFDPIISDLPMPRADTAQTNPDRVGVVRSVDFLPTAGGFLAYVYVGNGDLPEDEAEPLWLHSPNGRTWAEIPAPLELAGFLPFSSIAEYDGRMVAVGNGVRLSEDHGLTWTEVVTSPSEIPVADSIAAGPAGWMMPAGQAGIFWESADLLVSVDGATWETSFPDVPAVTGMLVTHNLLLVATFDGGWSADPIHQIWVGTIITP